MTVEGNYTNAVVVVITTMSRQMAQRFRDSFTTNKKQNRNQSYLASVISLAL